MQPDDFPQGTTVLSRDGSEIGVCTGRKRGFSSFDGYCDRPEVRWSNGSITFPHPKGLGYDKKRRADYQIL